MKACLRILACVALAAAGALSSALASPPVSAPVITGIEGVGTNLVVTIEAPEGARRITLASQDRLGRGGWVPRAVLHLDGQGGEVRLVVPRMDPCLVLRVSADDDGGLPGGFFDGQDDFASAPIGSPAYQTFTGGYRLDAWGGDGPVAPPTVEPGTEPREVVESDIWKIHGDRLFFFNQYRGLQVIDIAEPDQPALLGTLNLPAAGEQMYVLSDRHLALLVRSACGYGAESGSACLVVDVSGPAPAIVASVPVAGDILESRLVGTALYLASTGYRPVDNSTSWAWRTTIASFDLSDPAHPMPRQTFEYAGYDPVIAATDQWVFAALRSPDDYQASTLHAVNIASPIGTMWQAARLPIAGQVPDQFKMQLQGDVFSVIYETRSGTLSTRLETYRFLGLSGFQPLGEVELAHGERLFATRFDGDRAYLVTFEQIDPLWVLDLSNPRAPAIVGELEVPGFSTYIHPLGDQLVTVGRENSQVAVSLFGVGDPAHPVLQDRVLLGDDAWWSSSEATIDEKAFGVLEEERLILLPFEYMADHGHVSAVQLVDLLDQGLAERGRIEHGLRARRATVVGNRVVSVSGRELAVADVSNRDDPLVTATLPLSWAVDHVFASGDFLVELAAGWGGYGESAGAVARIAPADDPSDVLAAVPLGALPLAGAALRDGRLYLAQADGSAYAYNGWGPVPLATEDAETGDPEPPETYPLLLSVYDLSRLPEFEATGRAKADLLRPVYGNVEPLWPRPDLLVWTVQNLYWPYWGGPMLDVAYGFAPWYGSPESRLLAFDVSDPAQPAFSSDFSLAGGDWWTVRGDVFAGGGMVYTSHSVQLDAAGRWIDPSGEDPSMPVPEPVAQIHVLDAIDYEDPTEPTPRSPVRLPGSLAGIARQGNLLYTVSYGEADSTTGAWHPELDALAYDGMAAHRVDSLRLPAHWTGWVTAIRGSVLFGTGETSDQAPGLSAVILTSEGRLVVAGQTDVPGTVYERVAVEDLLAARAANEVLVFGVSSLPQFELLARETPPGCIGYTLSHAHGTSGTTLWVPLGDYGTWALHLGP